MYVHVRRVIIEDEVKRGVFVNRELNEINGTPDVYDTRKEALAAAKDLKKELLSA